MKLFFCNVTLSVFRPRCTFRAKHCTDDGLTAVLL